MPCLSPRWIEFVQEPLKLALGVKSDDASTRGSNIALPDVASTILEAILEHGKRGPEEARACAQVLDFETLLLLVSNFPAYALVFFKKLELTAVAFDDSEFMLPR